MKDISILQQQAVAIREKAYAPYSHFLVGACLEAENGELFVGCNVENASYGLTICAESSAITAMVAAGLRSIKQIVVVVEGPKISGCCGACRQRIYEFSSVDTLIHLCDIKGKSVTYQRDAFLPHAFGPEDVN